VDASKKTFMATGILVFDFELFIGDRCDLLANIQIQYTCASVGAVRLLPGVVLDKPPVIPIYSSHVFFDHREPNQPSNILDPLSKIAKSCTSVQAILVGVNIALDLPSIRH
jgi:hypothetical protein